MLQEFPKLMAGLSVGCFEVDFECSVSQKMWKACTLSF